MMKNLFNYWIFGLSILLLTVSIGLNISHTIVSNESIVLVFVGVLATFIVVGNYAQVVEIKNNTDAQIRALESQTQSKLEELNFMFTKLTETTKRINKLETQTLFNSAEACRLYGILAEDQKQFKNATIHLLRAITYYEQSEQDKGKINRLIETVANCLLPRNWETDAKEINYNEYINTAKKISDRYAQKELILNRLNQYFEKEINKQ